jgi:hypothetical protein
LYVFFFVLSFEIFSGFSGGFALHHEARALASVYTKGAE